MAIKFRKPAWGLLLFSLPFLGIGLGFLVFCILPTLYLAFAVPQWDEVSVQLTSAKLQTTYNDGTTYEATASYSYTYKDQFYQSQQVGFTKGSDNVGNWQVQKGRELESRFNRSQTVTAYVNPNKPEQVYLYADVRWGLLGFKLIFVVVFGGVGALVFLGSILEFPSSLSKISVTGSSARQTAQSGHIYSSARKTFWGLLGISVFMLAISSPVLFAIPDEWQSGNKAVVIALIFPVIGLGFLVAAVKEGFRILRFGRSPLVMSPYPAGIGGYLGATVSVNTPYNPQTRFKVSLTSINDYRTRSGGKSKRVQRAMWSEQGVAYVERSSKGNTLLRFNFNIPQKCSATTEVSESYYYWRVDIEATLKGIKFKRSFEVPVLNVDNPKPTSQYLALQHPHLKHLTNERITDIKGEDKGSSYEFWVPRFAYPLERLAGVLFGAVFVGSGIGVYFAGAPILFPIFFVPPGLLIGLFSLRSFLTKIRTYVGADGIHEHRSTLGIIRKQRQITLENLSGFSKKNASNWQNNAKERTFFAIEAKNRNGKPITIVDRVEGKEAVRELIKRFEQITGKNS